MLLGLALLALLQPDCFRFCVGQFLKFEAWRNGVGAQIGAIQGSLFEPVVLHDSVWSYEGESGPVTRLEIKTATATFSWRHLVPRSSGQWFQRLTLEGVTGKMQLPLAAEMPAKRRPYPLRLPRPSGRWLTAPERFEAVDVDFILSSGNDYVRLLQTRLTLSNVEPGTVSAGQILVKQPWLTRTFRQVAGTTAIQDGTVQIAGLTLEPGVKVQDFSLDIDTLANAQVKFAVKLAAFGGSLALNVQTLPDEPQFTIDVAGPFSQIDVAKLATFLGISDAAGGLIKTGNLSFRGPPQQFTKANAQLRFEASNFQWETRQWDSLVLGAKLLDGRIQIPELALTQGHNRLLLSGDMALPMPGVAWWRSEFSCDIEAKIENLTELSALLLPEFKYAAGRANIDGSVRGKDRKFTGQILVTGNNLRWRNAPIERLNASVKLNGNEYQITNVSLLNGADYLSGSGVVNIVGDKQYWGELRASVEDLAKYRAILQKPVVPESLAGGALIDWSGEGSATGHSGKFLARLRKVRSLGASAGLLHPIDADFEGSYSNGGMVFSGFALSDDESSLTANVGVMNKAVSLQGIRLMHKQTLWLEGDALLPLDVWNAWPNTSLDKMLSDDTVSRLNLTAYDLSLKETAQLSGIKFPIEGLVRGTVTAEGLLGALKTGGKLTLRKGRLPIGWSGVVLSEVEAETSFEGQTLRVEKSAGQHPTGDFAARGEVDFANLRDPGLKFAVTSAKSRFRPFQDKPGDADLTIETEFALQLSGPVSRSTVKGEAKFNNATLTGFNERQWLLGDLAGGIAPFQTLDIAPWNAWQLDVHATANNVGLNAQMLSADLSLKGTPATPVVAGRVSLRAAPENTLRGLITHASSTVSLQTATLDFREGFASDPIVVADASGVAAGEPFALQVTGTSQRAMRVFLCQPPLTQAAIRAALNGESAARFFSGENRFSLLVPAALREDVEIADWSTIKAEPAPLETLPLPASGTPP